MDFQDWTGSPLQKRPDRILPSVSAAVFDGEGRLLLQHRSDNDHWALPGGKVEIGESVGQAVVREVFEETGLHVVVERLVGVYSDPVDYAIASYPDGLVVHYVNLCFECSMRNGVLRGSSEGPEVGFFPPEALPKRLLLSHRIRIRDALAGQGEPFIR